MAPFSSRRNQTKPTQPSLSDDAILEAAIAQRSGGAPDASAYGAQDVYDEGAAAYGYDQQPPSQTVSTVSFGSSAHQTPLASRETSFARPYQQGGNLQVSMAGGAGHGATQTSTKHAAGAADGEAPEGGGPLSTWSGRATIAFFSLVTLADLLLHLAFAFRVGTFYGGDRAEHFWWVIVLGLIGSLLGIVMIVSRVAAQQTPAGLGLQKRLDEKREQTGMLLMLCVVHPELLRCLLPGLAHALTIVKIDMFASLLGGVPFMAMAINFAAENGFGDRYGLLRTLIAEVGGGAAGRMLHVVPEQPPFAPPPPPVPPPPPFPPTDPSGDTVVLAIFAASWTCAALGLKLIRLAIAWQTSALTGELQRQVASLRVELDAERKARAEEHAELTSLRDYYYGGDQAYADQYAEHL